MKTRTQFLIVNVKVVQCSFNVPSVSFSLGKRILRAEVRLGHERGKSRDGRERQR